MSILRHRGVGGPRGGGGQDFGRGALNSRAVGAGGAVVGNARLLNEYKPSSGERLRQVQAF